MSLPLFLTATTANQIWQREYYIFDSKFWYTLPISPKKNGILSRFGPKKFGKLKQKT